MPSTSTEPFWLLYIWHWPGLVGGEWIAALHCISWKCFSLNKPSWHFECNKKHAKWLIQSNKWHKKREWRGISSLQNNFLLSKNNSSLFGMSNNDFRWYLFHSKSRLNLLTWKKVSCLYVIESTNLFYFQEPYENWVLHCKFHICRQDHLKGMVISRYSGFFWNFACTSILNFCSKFQNLSAWKNV